MRPIIGRHERVLGQRWSLGIPHSLSTGCHIFPAHNISKSIIGNCMRSQIPFRFCSVASQNRREWRNRRSPGYSTFHCRRRRRPRSTTVIITSSSILSRWSQQIILILKASAITSASHITCESSTKIFQNKVR